MIVKRPFSFLIASIIVASQLLNASDNNVDKTNQSSKEVKLPDFKIRLEKSDLRARKFDPETYSTECKKYISLVAAEETFTGSKESLRYRLFTPKPNISKKVPLVIFLHGYGDQNENAENIQLRHPQCMTFISPENQKKAPCFFMAPRLNGGKHWGGVIETYEDGMPQMAAFRVDKPTDTQVTLVELISKLIKDNPGIDPERIYLTGLSSGGSGCFSIAYNFPGHFAGLIPVCAGHPRLLDQTKKTHKLAIWAFVNRNDEEEVRKACGLILDKYKALGGEVHYSTYTDQGVGGHSAWNWAYAEPDLIPWLFKQKRIKVKDVPAAW